MYILVWPGRGMHRMLSCNGVHSTMMCVFYLKVELCCFNSEAYWSKAGITSVLDILLSYKWNQISSVLNLNLLFTT